MSIGGTVLFTASFLAVVTKADAVNSGTSDSWVGRTTAAEIRAQTHRAVADIGCLEIVTMFGFV